MHAAVGKLGGTDAETELAARMVSRCLAMANAAVQPIAVSAELPLTFAVLGGSNC